MPILHYLRTKTVNCRDVDLKTLKHEAEFYGVLPLGELASQSVILTLPSGTNVDIYTMLWKRGGPQFMCLVLYYNSFGVCGCLSVSR